MTTNEPAGDHADVARDRELARYASDVVLIIDAEARVRYLSPSAERAMGYRAEDWLGRDATSVIHPDDLERALGAFGRALAIPGVNEPLEMRVRHVGGEWHWFEVVATNLLHHPAIEGVVLCAHDISERVAAHLALQRSDERLHALLRHSSDVVVVVRADGILSYVSPSAARVLGYDGAAGTPLRALDFVHPDDRERASHALQDHLSRTAGPAAVDVRVAHRDGTWRNIELVATNGLDDPAVDGIVCNLRDVTDLRHVQLEAIQAGRRYEALLANLTDLVTVVDASGTITYVSPATTQVLGRHADGRVGKSIFETVHPDDAPDASAIVERVLATSGLMQPFDARVRHEDGTYRTLEVRVNNLLDDPAVRGIIVNSRDITDRVNAERALRDSERLYRTIVETADEGIWMFDADARTTFVNRRMADLLHSTVDRLLGRDAFDFVPEAGLAAARSNLERRRAGQSDHHDFEILREDGTTFWASVSVSPLADQSGAYRGSVALVTDLTARLADEAALRAAELERHQHQAEIARHRLEVELNQTRRLESLGRLAAGVAHDFNNLLGVILNYAEAASRQLTPESRAAADVAQIRQAAQQAVNVTRELLTFGRGDTPLPETFDARELVTATTRLVGRSLPGDIRLTVDLGAEPCAIHADRTQIGQALLNLLINARDAMPNGGDLVVGSRVARSSDGALVTLWVTDAGTGMSEDVRQRAFEPFFTTKPPEHATGLGLSTVHAIVTQAQGYVSIESQTGAGTTVSMRFPEARPHRRGM